MTNEAPITTLGLAAIVFFTTAVTTIIPLWWASRRKTKDEAERITAQRIQWERDDNVANRVAEAADQAARAAVLLVESNAKVSENAHAVNGKLDTIHDLVNSNMTAQIEDSMNSKKREVIALKEVFALQKAQKIEPSEEALGIIKATEEQIEELQSRLNDRKKQQEVIDANKLTVTMTLPGAAKE